MKKCRIFAFFILLALLLTCVGVSFASDDFNNSFIADTSIDEDIEIDDSDLNDEDYLDDEDWDSDDYLDDEDWDDEYLDDEDLDDEEYLDDEDWDEEDLDDEEYPDDEDWDEEDWDDEEYPDDEIDWMEEGNFTEDGKVYYYQLISYKSGKAIGCAFMASNAPSAPFSESEDKDMANSNDDNNSSDEISPVSGSKNHYGILKSADLNSLKDSIPTNDTQNTSISNKINNETSITQTNENDVGILALLAALLLSIVVFV